jgi:hypothetical protein
LPENHPMWDAWEQIKSAYPGNCANWEDEPPTIWAHAINDMDQKQVDNGIRNLVHFDNNGFPPNAAQFRDLCLTDFGWERRAHKPASEILGIESKSHLTDTNQEAGKDFFKDLNKGWAQ